MPATLNPAIGLKLSKPGEYVRFAAWPEVFLNSEAFAAANVKEADAERIVGEALTQTKLARDYYTKAQLATGTDLPPTQLARRYQHSYSPYGGWYVLALPPPFLAPYAPPTTEHYSPYNYNTHVPLIFYGTPFQPGTYRTHAEPVDLAVTLASLLGINRPTHAVGRVLSEAVREPQPASSKSGSSARGRRPK